MKIVIIEPIGVESNQLLKLAEDKLQGHEIIYYDTRTTETEELIERGKDADVIVVSNLPMNAQVIEGCKQLKLLSVAFTGVDHIAMEQCKKQGVQVCNCAGYSNAAVADLVFGMIISLYRNVIPCNEVVRQGGTKEGLVGMELEGKRFGIIGMGAIGQRVAMIAKAFGCEVVAYNRSPKVVYGVKFLSLEEVLRTSDIVSLHVPLTEETKGMINQERLSYMKPEAILINTARGPVVESEALAEALSNGKLAGAGIDVFEMEPPLVKEHVLFHTPNTIVTPHIGFATTEALVKRAHIVFDNIKHWEMGTTKNRIL